MQHFSFCGLSLSAGALVSVLSVPELEEWNTSTTFDQSLCRLCLTVVLFGYIWMYLVWIALVAKPQGLVTMIKRRLEVLASFL